VLVTILLIESNEVLYYIWHEMKEKEKKSMQSFSSFMFSRFVINQRALIDGRQTYTLPLLLIKTSVNSYEEC
jgi:hypothetical protein